MEKAASSLLYAEFWWVEVVAVVEVVEVVEVEMAVTTISGTDDACVSVRFSWEVSGLVNPSLSSLNSSYREDPVLI